MKLTISIRYLKFPTSSPITGSEKLDRIRLNSLKTLEADMEIVLRIRAGKSWMYKRKKTEWFIGTTFPTYTIGKTSSNKHTHTFVYTYIHTRCCQHRCKLCALFTVFIRIKDAFRIITSDHGFYISWHIYKILASRIKCYTHTLPYNYYFLHKATGNIFIHFFFHFYQFLSSFLDT